MFCVGRAAWGDESQHRLYAIVNESVLYKMFRNFESKLCANEV